jgi:hypothetical protein
MTRPHVTMRTVNQGRKRGVDVLREFRREKCRRVLEEFAGLVLICREILSATAGESVRVSKFIREETVPGLTAMAARS